MVHHVAVQNALNDYYRLLAVLEQELTRSSAPLPAPTEGEGASNHTVNEGTSGLTLLRLRAWMLEPLDRCVGEGGSVHAVLFISFMFAVLCCVVLLFRMCLMARITDCAVPLAGGGLISRYINKVLPKKPVVIIYCTFCLSAQFYISSFVFFALHFHEIVLHENISFLGCTGIAITATSD